MDKYNFKKFSLQSILYIKKLKIKVYNLQVNPNLRVCYVNNLKEEIFNKCFPHAAYKVQKLVQLSVSRNLSNAVILNLKTTQYSSQFPKKFLSQILKRSQKTQMVVNMKKWSPWNHEPTDSTETRKFRVKVERIKLDGFEHGGGGGEKVIGVELRWNGERKHGLKGVGFRRRGTGERWCKEKVVRKGEVIVWEEEDDLENVCLFSIVEHKFVPWIVGFKFTYGEFSKGKMAKMGKVSLNLAEFASKIDSQMIEKILPIDLEIAGLTTQASISVLLSFVQIRDPNELVPESTRLEDIVDVKTKKKQLSMEEVCLSDSDNSVTFDSDESSESQVASQSLPSVNIQPEHNRKHRLFDWKRRRLTHKSAKTKTEDSQLDTFSEYKNPANNSWENKWETREFISRDGESKLKTQSFFASFDQRSEKAAGPSACTALVTVIAHWLGSNDSTTMPTVQQFENLIIEGSSEWRSLCQNGAHVAQFPDKHFDLETVLRAKIRPLSVSREKSFVGFFSPEKFDSLSGVMSFDDLWDQEISKNQGVYIVSWNDHFFVLKVDEDGYYIIDTLGERLVEGCDQAYILRFDNGSCLTESGTNDVICNGKECCEEFIKRFLAAIPLKELEIEEQKESVPYCSLHHRLQIEFNFCNTV